MCGQFPNLDLISVCTEHYSNHDEFEDLNLKQNALYSSSSEPSDIQNDAGSAPLQLISKYFLLPLLQLPQTHEKQSNRGESWHYTSKNQILGNAFDYLDLRLSILCW